MRWRYLLQQHQRQRVPRLHQAARGNSNYLLLPISEASASKNPFGYQIIGPYPCQKKVFDQCGPAANELNGSTIPVGAPTGAARFLSIKLYGKNPEVNECFP